MNILAISGSSRAESTNTFLLKEVAAIAEDSVCVVVFHSLDLLPVFNPDREIEIPESVQSFCNKINHCDGIIISSPEYIRSIPGGLKNAIDWLVSRDEIIAKPIVLMHASHRGMDVLESLRRVLSTVSENFNENIFLQIPLIGMNQQEIRDVVKARENTMSIKQFINEFTEFTRAVNSVI